MRRRDSLQPQTGYFEHDVETISCNDMRHVRRDIGIICSWTPDIQPDVKPAASLPALFGAIRLDVSDKTSEQFTASAWKNNVKIKSWDVFHFKYWIF